MTSANPEQSASTRPLIGLPGRRKLGSEIAGFPDAIQSFELDVYFSLYSDAVREAGGLPIHIPLNGEPRDYIPILHGLLLPGGADVETSRYQAEPDGNGSYEPFRDQMELALLEDAISADIPVLGICRGFQVMNVHAGGTLHQDVPSHALWNDEASDHVHQLNFEPQSRLGLMYGSSRGVNSLHHQTIDAVGEGLVVSATAPDGTIEGLEMAGADVIGVQWHPEMLTNRELNGPEPVFAWLINRARSRI